MAGQVTPLQRALVCIQEKKHFLLQGGAGSGKTETLSQLIKILTNTAPALKVACITHTNKAAEEIKSRVPADHYVGTIHAFLNMTCGKYKKNLHLHIWKIFSVQKIIRKPVSDYSDEKKHRLEEHDRFKKFYKKFSSMYFTIHSIRIDPPPGKKIYDVDFERINIELNELIDTLNTEIRSKIEARNWQEVSYNNTRFNNFREMSFGHDGLLALSVELFKEYPLMGKIITDKFDCIFVDEFQDTKPEIVDVLVHLPRIKTTVGFFGDSMQSIYSNGVGDIERFVKDEKLLKIEKEDNYRCSEQVVSFINQLRYDGLKQKVAYKTIGGKIESIDDRQGTVCLYYAIYKNKPNVYSSREDKDNYEHALNLLITQAMHKTEESKTLLLSNKAIASKGLFTNIFRPIS